MQYTNLELENLTLQWGIDRKITINGKLETQFLKLIEESGELFSSGDDIEKIKDAIGDQLVVLTMINGLTNDRFILDISIDQPSSFSEAVKSDIKKIKFIIKLLLIYSTELSKA